ncbi:phosphopantetheine-binding protein [Streptomyces sp. M-16]|uniref:phosphopantetheine-binding protein n=1 Tax=Streptomyces sp. M-16 TaxID=3233040 RepID=UPI002250F361
MTSIDGFITLVRDDLGLTISDSDVDRPLEEIAGWDSLHLLTLLSALERAEGRSLSLPAALEATTLRGLYDVAVTG